LGTWEGGGEKKKDIRVCGASQKKTYRKPVENLYGRDAAGPGKGWLLRGETAEKCRWRLGAGRRIVGQKKRYRETEIKTMRKRRMPER